MNNQYLWDRITGRDPFIRAGDADRERIEERLRTSQAEGRLDLTEFQQRLESCYQAKTLGELDELVRDLPGPAERDARRPLDRFRALGWGLAPLTPILIVLIVVSVAVGHHVWLWIPVVFLFWRMSSMRRNRWWAVARRGPDEWI